MPRVRRGVGGRGVERYGLPKLPFYFHAVYLSIRKQFIPEQLDVRSYAFRLEKEIFQSKKGNCNFRRTSLLKAQTTIEYRGEREATAVLPLRQCRTVDKEAVYRYTLLRHYRINPHR